MTPIRTIPDAYTPADGALAERTILITGAATGIGRAMARAAADAGATVVLLDRQLRGLEKVYDEIEKDGGPQPALYPLDLLGASPDDYAELVDRLWDSLGGIDTLVHNAAELGQPAPLAHYDIESWYRTLQINLNAPFLLTRACLPLLLAAQSPRLLFVSDSAGRQGKPFTGAYGVSKWGLEGLLQTLVAELPDDTPLLASSVNPGPVRTALRRKAYPAEPAESHPPPESVAGRLLFTVDPANPVTQGGRYRLHDQDGSGA